MSTQSHHKHNYQCHTPPHLARSWVVDCHDRSAPGCTCSIQSPSSHGWRTAAFLGIAWLVQDPSTTTKWFAVDFGGFPWFFLDFAPFPSWASTWINQHAVWIHPSTETTQDVQVSGLVLVLPFVAFLVQHHLPNVHRIMHWAKKKQYCRYKPLFSEQSTVVCYQKLKLVPLSS